MGIINKIFNKSEKEMKEEEVVCHLEDDQILKERNGIKYHPDNKQYSGRIYKNYSDGSLTYTGSYKDGKRDGKWTWYHENGMIKIEGKFKDGMNKVGIWTSYYENGQIREEVNYTGAMNKDGIWTSYYENGQIREEANYKDGEEYGERTFYNKDGTQMKIIDDEKITYYHSIIKLLKERGEKMATSDIDAFLKSQDIDGIKEQCELMYHNGDINRTSNYRYFILSEEKKAKKTKPEKTETVDVKSELKKYKEMLDEGLIDKEDYEAKKKELLGI